MLINNDNIQALKELKDNSIDSVVTDPPYGWSFMGKSWDYDVPNVETWKELMRVLKPGGHIIVACGTRTQHRMAVNIEDAGFEIRDIVAWVYGSGFPKSLNIGKAVDKLQGNEREVIGTREVPDITGDAYGTMNEKQGGSYKPKQIEDTKGNSPYEGWGTALKPAMELWTLARKPLSEKTVAENVLKWGTGGINIDECRVKTDEKLGRQQYSKTSALKCSNYEDKFFNPSRGLGRFPANFIHDGSDEVVGMFPETKGGGSQNGSRKWKGEEGNGGYGGWAGKVSTDNYISRDNGKGSASRFFYCAKASKSERNAGLDGFEVKQTVGGGGGVGNYLDDVNSASGKYGSEKAPNKNHHPTIKPISLMRYLTRLITPKGGIVLDPYMGSGTTGIACKLEGFNFIGIEIDKEYYEIAKARIENAK